MAGGRRRTDLPDAPPPSAAEADPSEHPTTPGRRAERRRDGLLTPAEDPGRPQRPEGPRADESGRLPRAARPDVPTAGAGPRDTPAPQSRRPPVPPAAPRRVAPRTTVVPFQAVPPEAQPDRYSPERLAQTPPRGSGRPLGGGARPAPASGWPVPAPGLPWGHPSAPVPDPAAFAPRPAVTEAARYAGPPTEAEHAPVRPRSDDSGPAPRSTGPAGARAGQPRPASAALAAAVRPGQGATHPSGPLYGDWTRPSRSGSDSGRVAPGPVTGDHVVAAPPATTAIPDRDAARRREGAARPRDVGAEEPGRPDTGAPARAAGPVTDPGTGPSTQVRGGRAAYRAERQAADAERRKAAKRNGETMTARAYLDDEDDVDRRRSPRRTVFALVAVALVALGVLGVYSFTSPDTQNTSAGSAVTSSPAAPSSAGPAATLPPLSIAPAPVTEAPATPVRVPVTVLNATSVTGLAGRIAGTLQGGGWEAPATGQYKGGDVAVTTVFFTQGDETQRQAALQLVDQFPEITGPAPRFFEVPDQPTPGLVVVAAGEWQP